jgi:hypothetical protein
VRLESELVMQDMSVRTGRIREHTWSVGSTFFVRRTDVGMDQGNEVSIMAVDGTGPRKDAW